MKIKDLIELLEEYKDMNDVYFKLGGTTLEVWDTIQAKNYLTIFLEEK
jgi:hypothetical protein